MPITQIRKRLPLIIALACGIWAILLLNIYLKRREGEIETKIWEKIKPQLQNQSAKQPVMAAVLVAGKDIPPQVPITHTDLLIKEVPVDYIQPQAVASLEEVIGQIASVPIMAGEQILKTKLLPPGKIGKSLSEITPAGKRAVTVSVDNIASGLALIRPGDFVDVSALISLPSAAGQAPAKESGPRLVLLFQNIEVLAVGSEFVVTPESAKKEQAKTTGAGSTTVTLALSPQEAALLSFVQENGKIKLTLRALEDTRKETVRPADWDTLLQYLSGGKGPAPEGKQPATVEIYRGVNKETVPLSEGAK